jgi:hypothetical protein
MPYTILEEVEWGIEKCPNSTPNEEEPHDHPESF